MPQQRSEETHGKILQAALTCFSHSGYDATGVAEICAAAGVSKGAFYHHYPSKQAVFIELLNAWLNVLDARFALLRAENTSVPDALRAMTRATRQIFKDARGQMPLYLEFWTQAMRDPLVWGKTVEPYHRYERYFADLIRAGIAEGSLRPTDPDAAARTLLALALGMLLQSVTRGMSEADEPDWAETIQQSVEMLLNGLMA